MQAVKLLVGGCSPGLQLIRHGHPGQALQQLKRGGIKGGPDGRLARRCAASAPQGRVPARALPQRIL
jgi:hypothetical protein